MLSNDNRHTLSDKITDLLDISGYTVKDNIPENLVDVL
jgi:hypothetical protein